MAPGQLAITWWQRRVEELERRVAYRRANRGPDYWLLTRDEELLKQARQYLAESVAEKLLEGEHDADDF